MSTTDLSNPSTWFRRKITKDDLLNQVSNIYSRLTAYQITAYQKSVLKKKKATVYSRRHNVQFCSALKKNLTSLESMIHYYCIIIIITAVAVIVVSKTKSLQAGVTTFLSHSYTYVWPSSYPILTRREDYLPIRSLHAGVTTFRLARACQGEPVFCAFCVARMQAASGHFDPVFTLALSHQSTSDYELQ